MEQSWPFGVVLLIAALSLWGWLRKRSHDDFEIMNDSPGKGQLTRVENSSSLEVRDVFDERLILKDLEDLSTQPLLFDQYIVRAKKRFTKSNQIALLNNWKRLYESATDTIEAATALRQAQSKYSQFRKADEITFAEKEVRLEQLEADKQEAKLRAHKARQQMLGAVPDNVPQSKEDKQMHAAVERHRRDICFDIQTRAGKKLTTLAELQRWYKQKRSDINHDRSLSGSDRDELHQMLENEFYKHKKELESDIDIFGDD